MFTSLVNMKKHLLREYILKTSLPYLTILLYGALIYISAAPVTATLQYGLNQYDDFEDTHSHNRQASTNNAKAEFLEIRCDGC